MRQRRLWQVLVLALVVAATAWAQFPFNANDPANTSQVAIAFTGGSVWTSGTTGICMWYFPVVGTFDLKALFMTNSTGAPIVDMQHAYLIWVSDFSVQVLPTPAGQFLALAPSGTATIYYSSNPAARDLSDRTKRSTWGEVVATFTRAASIVRSGDGLASDTFTFSADLVSSRTFSLNGRMFNFNNLIPQGMTCFEYGQNGSSFEAGTCVAIGSGR